MGWLITGNACQAIFRQGIRNARKVRKVQWEKQTRIDAVWIEIG